MAKPNIMAKMKFGSMQHKQAAQTLKKALEEDPTVFQYDEVYDEMDKDRTEKREKAKGDKKPKYIGELMKTAERRQRENERRIEKQAQKDIEKEGDMYKDKEAFVTGAYKRKMEELKRLEDEEKRQDAIDDMAEVTKQKDLSGFYRHLYRQTMHEEKTGKEVKDEKETDESSPAKKAKYEKSSSDEEEHGSSPRHQSSSRKDSESHHHHREKGKELERHKEKRHHHRDRSRDRDTDKERRRDSDEKRGRDKMNAFVIFAATKIAGMRDDIAHESVPVPLAVIGGAGVSPEHPDATEADLRVGAHVWREVESLKSQGTKRTVHKLPLPVLVKVMILSLQVCQSNSVSILSGKRER
ncbi:Nuclear speckle splicing regulatory protein 1 [Orchesella cincta]|uniref:Nuclear speckle splicing regulatory protein 1 n=1 Tax=Orchesella cincta TaxID=48709 RepID=A0A1D2MQ67_ORCCI|nr:Nuclear speckle splicing regulatory protein 1 [Orchesella cincta]